MNSIDFHLVPVLLSYALSFSSFRCLFLKTIFQRNGATNISILQKQKHTLYFSHSILNAPLLTLNLGFTAPLKRFILGYTVSIFIFST